MLREEAQPRAQLCSTHQQIPWKPQYEYNSTFLTKKYEILVESPLLQVSRDLLAAHRSLCKEPSGLGARVHRVEQHFG